MNGDIVFIDFDKGVEEDEPLKPSSQLPLSRAKKAESRADKIKRLATQIESGEYKVNSEQLTEAVLGDLLGSVEED